MPRTFSDPLANAVIRASANPLRIDSGISDKTTSIFLESAFFNPISVRKSAKHHNLSTDSSYRFERGVDIELIEHALKRAASLIKDSCDGEIICDIIDEYPSKIEEKNISEQKIEEKEVKNSNVSGEQNKIIVPSLGESISEALISKWMKSAGENVKKGEPIVELETDKVTQELYAESSGVLKEILFNEQEEVKIGETIGIIDLIEHEIEDSIGSDLVNTNEPTKDIKEETENAKDLDPTKIKRTSLNNKIGVNDLREFIQDVSLSPSAKKFINESKNEINKLNIIATNGRVTKESFSNLKPDSGRNAFSENENILSNSTDVSKPLSKMRQSIAHRLKEAQNTAAMLTTFNEIDMENVISLRAKYKDYFLKKYDTKLGFMSFFTKACISVLKEIPEVNAEIKNNSTVSYTHLTLPTKRIV